MKTLLQEEREREGEKREREKGREEEREREGEKREREIEDMREVTSSRERSKRLKCVLSQLFQAYSSSLGEIPYRSAAE
ncbi:hypothetical protein V513_08180 [Mesotoga sp. H07.pep.5.3]|nr:hypothetical protein V513_08180 [Mesotoga sp. H07.pep.5.3]HPA00122.1 hypothetical protein [Mesotoga prima]